MRNLLLTIAAIMMMMNSCNGQTREPVVRPATQANRFYTGDAGELRREVDSLLALHSGATMGNVAALIVPHAGYYFSGSVAASAYMTLDPGADYKRIFLLGPSHQVWLDGASVNTSADYYSTPLGNVKVDRETAMALTDADSVFAYRPEAHAKEHCLEVQLPFLQRFYALHSKEVPPIVPVIISTNDFRKLKRMAEVLKPYFTDESLFIISSDFSHYPSYEDACEVDALTGKAIETGDVGQFLATIQTNARSGRRNLETSACGAYPITTMMLMLDSHYDIKHLMYRNSGDTDDHDRRRVVGYHSFAIIRKGGQQTNSTDNGHQQAATDFILTDEDKKLLKDIALQSISMSVECRTESDTSLECRVDSVEFATAQSSASSSAVANSKLYTLNSTLNRRCGAFVSLHKHGRLRGCIGHFGEDVPLHEIVAEMARAAAFEDPRFPPVRSEELDDIDIEISVLTPMRRIQSLDEFELHRHGIYIRKGRRSGTFLPQVADQVDWTKEEFVGHCSQDKAGLGWNGWRDAELYVYEAIVF